MSNYNWVVGAENNHSISITNNGLMIGNGTNITALVQKPWGYVSPNQVLTSRLGMPTSADVGTSGSEAMRLGAFHYISKAPKGRNGTMVTDAPASSSRPQGRAAVSARTAMLARGFSGEFHTHRESRFGMRELGFIVGWSMLFILFRTAKIPELLGTLITGAF